MTREELTEKMVDAVYDSLNHGIDSPWDTVVEDDCRDAVQAALTAIEEAGFLIVEGWKPIITAPTDGTPVLLRGKLEGEIHAFPPVIETIVGRFSHGRWTMDNTDGYEVNCYADLWMPLPPSPNDTASKLEEDNA